MPFRRQSSLTCFFCQSTSSATQNPRNFRCKSCGCWNRLGDDGELVTEEPAMHVESLNADSFAKRASPSRDQLPAIRGKGLFCHNCQSNQLLIVNLLSNYLPSPDDPEHAYRVRMLPQYRESLHARYPPVCENCRPAVEDEIKRKDHMARTKALGGWLKESMGKEMQRRVLDVNKEIDRPMAENFLWKTRGLLWTVTLFVAFWYNLTGALAIQRVYPPDIVKPLLPLIILFSLFWTAWDPTYLSFRRAKQQGLDIRVRGKTTYIRMQIAAWFSRLATSCLITLTPNFNVLSSQSTTRIYYACSFIFELTAFVVSCCVLRLHKPPLVRLVDTNSHVSRPASPPLTNLPTTNGAVQSPFIDNLDALSLSSRPIVTPSNPVFGLPSFPSGASASQDPDAMDWTPTDPLNSGMKVSDGTWLRPQRFFAPEKPTGLEGLFERTLLVDDDLPTLSSGRASAIVATIFQYLQKWWWVYLSILVTIGAVMYRGLYMERGTTSPFYGPQVSSA